MFSPVAVLMTVACLVPSASVIVKVLSHPLSGGRSVRVFEFDRGICWKLHEVTVTVVVPSFRSRKAGRPRLIDWNPTNNAITHRATMAKERWLYLNIDVALGAPNAEVRDRARDEEPRDEEEPTAAGLHFPHDAIAAEIRVISDEPEEGNGSNNQSHEDDRNGVDDLLEDACACRALRG